MLSTSCVPLQPAGCCSKMMSFPPARSLSVALFPRCQWSGDGRQPHCPSPLSVRQVCQPPVAPALLLYFCATRYLHMHIASRASSTRMQKPVKEISLSVVDICTHTHIASSPGHAAKAGQDAAEISACNPHMQKRLAQMAMQWSRTL
eukprot:SAG31_NODE_12242_length_956_cov_1.206534_2_plen_147_part_00